MKLFLLLFLVVTCLGQLTQAGDEDGRIDEALKSLGISPGQKLLERYPKLAKREVTITSECYNTTIDGIGLRRLDIFKDDISTIVKEYFQVNPNRIFGLIGDDFHNRIHSLIENLNNLVVRIYDCQTNPTSKKQPVCVTSMTALSSADWAHLSNLKPSKPTSTSFSRQSDSPKCSTKPLEGESPLPTSINWRKNGMVSPVRDQGGKCNTCYIFASVAAVESAYYISKESNTGEHFSEQAILNCVADVTKPETDPCRRPDGAHGGDPNDAFKRMIEEGVTLEENCPYTNHTHQCTKYPIFTKLPAYCSIMQDLSEEALQILLVRNGPFEVSIKMNGTTFKELCPNTIYEGPCDPNEGTDHVVLLYGYDEKYWFLKNSFGTNWGDEGHFRMPRKGNVCNIESAVYVALFKEK